MKKRTGDHLSYAAKLSKVWGPPLLIAPLVAVQVSKWLERRRDNRRLQVEVFKTLMTTRATSVSHEHVRALNMIDVVFHENHRIREAWKIYLDHLNDKSISAGAWGAKQLDLLVDLLHLMGNEVGYNFDKVHIRRFAYYPKGHGDIEEELMAIRQGFVRIMKGEAALPMVVANLPGPIEETEDQKRLRETEAQQQEELRTLMIDYYKNDSPLRVRLTDQDDEVKSHGEGEGEHNREPER